MNEKTKKVDQDNTEATPEEVTDVVVKDAVAPEPIPNVELDRDTAEFAQAEETFLTLFNHLPDWWNNFRKIPMIEAIALEQGKNYAVRCTAEVKKPKRHMVTRIFIIPQELMGLDWPELKKQIEKYEEVERAKRDIANGKKMAKIMTPLMALAENAGVEL